MTFEEAIKLEERNKIDIQKRIETRNDVCPVCGETIRELGFYLKETLNEHLRGLEYSIREEKPFWVDDYLKETPTDENDDGFFCENCKTYSKFEFEWIIDITMNMKLLKKYKSDENGQEIELVDNVEQKITDHPNQISISY